MNNRSKPTKAAAPPGSQRLLPSHRSVRRVEGFCAALGICRSKFYTLPTEHRPKTANLGAALVILETPDEYLTRIAAMQAEQGLA